MICLNWQIAISAPVIVAFLSSQQAYAAAHSMEKEQEFRQLLEKMERDVLAFRDSIESAYKDRCNLDVLRECGRNNYNDCNSIYPAQTCMEKDELVMTDCGDGDLCNALWDKSVSTVRIPAALARGSNGNPTDPEIIETVCYSQQAEDFMIELYEQDVAYWSKWGAAPSWSHFGAHNGAFRIYPSTQSKQCGTYDTRRRPWYVAASSGPKDVVLVIDVSGSMDDYGRIGTAKEAAKTIINTLTVADRVAVVAFSEAADLIAGQDRLIRATKQNKEVLLDAISGLKSRGGTNFYAGFKKAFDSLDSTITYESTTGCNIALLFLTDGMSTAGPDKENVIALVNDRTDQIASRWGRDVYIFTYSLGYEADHDVTKAIACQTGGLWTPVEDVDYGGDLVSTMSSYYKLFALGLGEGDNEGFTAWVEPFTFYTGGKMGTTVSAPVYDRSVYPPLFLGVVAIDSYMDALEQVSGEDATSSAMLDRFVRLSTARCPKLSLTECELDALRYLGGGDQAKCNTCNSSDFIGLVPQKCRGVSDYPRDLWKNADMKGQSYGDRACCEVGGTEPSGKCAIPAEGLSPGAIAGIAVGAGFAVFLFLWCMLRKAKQGNSSTNVAKASTKGVEVKQSQGTAGSRSMITESGTAYDGVTIAVLQEDGPPCMPSAPPQPKHSEPTTLSYK